MTLACGLVLAVSGLAAADPGTPPPDPGPDPVTQAQIQEVLSHEEAILAALATHAPDQHQQLLALKHSDRLSYLRELARIGRAVSRARQEPGALARALAIRGKTRELEALARDYRTLAEDRRPARRAEILRLAGEVMDLKQAERRARLAEMRARLEALQAEIDGRESQRDQIVEAYVDQLLDERVEL